MKILFVTTFILVLFGCSKKLDYDELGYLAIFSHAHNMKNKQHWAMEGFGGSFWGGDIKMLSAHFIVYSEAEYEQAVELFTNGVETFLEEINNNQKINTHLHNRPFTFKDIEYSLAFYTKEGAFLSYMFLQNGNIFYSLHDENKPMLQRIHEEPYTEALEKVKNGLKQSL